MRLPNAVRSVYEILRPQNRDGPGFGSAITLMKIRGQLSRCLAFLLGVQWRASGEELRQARHKWFVSTRREQLTHHRGNHRGDRDTLPIQHVEILGGAKQVR